MKCLSGASDAIASLPRAVCRLPVFVLVLLLGSIRGGLVAASLIPLSLLFAFILMRVFGVWANLMSLGAIDFGIIVDGAVIIVEGTVYELERHFGGRLPKGARLSQKGMDAVSIRAAGGVMHSAFFGQIILLIVFTPILFLSGVSGKMFQPMVFTFSFALIGAILLCFTYVPMVSAVFMRPTGGRFRFLARAEERLAGFSGGLMDAVYRLYHPLLRFAMRHKSPSQGGKTFEPREVRTGRKEGGMTEILSGLSKGETIAAAGAYTLLSEWKKSEVGED